MRPDESLEPWLPSVAEPWDRERAARLARRAGFGASPPEVEELAQLGLEAAVGRLLDFPDEDPVLERELALQGSPLVEYPSEGGSGQPQVGDERAWWIYRMARGAHPAQERLTLFWHHHFACQQSEELAAGLMLGQNRLFRRLGAGSFRELLGAVARDPAMLVFLDGRKNVCEKPNENWARELMELFTLGLDRYTQRDVVAVARIFSGWGLSEERSPRFEFHERSHDPGPRQVLGRAIAPGGEEQGDALLDLLLDQPSCAGFLARKLLRWYLEDEPSTALCFAFGECLRAHDWSVREALRTLFLSRCFHALRDDRPLFKTPADFVISAVREYGIQNPHLLELPRTLRALGMDLFHPPSVAGWELGPSWIHAGSVLLRAQFADQIAALPNSSRALVGTAALDLDRIADELGIGAAAGREERHARTRAALRIRLAEPEFALA
jgi:uncharacterized protein (DUF1800 family)